MANELDKNDTPSEVEGPEASESSSEMEQEPVPPTSETIDKVEDKSKLKAFVTSKKFLWVVIVMLSVGLVVAVLLLRNGESSQEDNVVVATTDESIEVPNDVSEDFEISEDDLKHLDIPDKQITVSSKLESIPYVEGVFTEAGLVEYYTTDHYGLDQDTPRNNVAWYKLGSVDGSDIILATASSEGLFTTYNKAVFSRDASGVYTLLKNHSSDDLPALEGTVKSDTDTNLTAFEVPEEITVEGAVLKSLTDWKIPEVEYGLGFDQSLDGYTKLADTDYGVMYEKIETGGDEDGVKSYKLLLEMPFGTLAGYRFIVSPLLDDGSMPVSFNNGDNTNYVYRWDTVERGCGSSHQVNVLAKQYHGDLVEVGNSSGAKVYELPNADHAVVGEFYETYKSGRKDEDVISRQEYFNGHNVVVLKNKLSYYVMLSNNQYQANVECAKPVIYLYPEQSVHVSVKVGADVTKSEPAYNNGWNAIALPSGQLFTLQGVYDSLFWDGIGYGQYPEITKGNIVNTADVESTLVSNMARMGLNDKEINDFLEYWLPLMPDNEFVRLTWLTTEEMNSLAPLELSFMPDSMIRIFLDFEGLDEPHEIEKQNIPKYQRHGFSLIEWGGLKIGD